MADRYRREPNEQAGYFEDGYGRQQEQFSQPQSQPGERYRPDYDEPGYGDDYRGGSSRASFATREGYANRSRGGSRGYNPLDDYDRESTRFRSRNEGSGRSRGFYGDYDDGYSSGSYGSRSARNRYENRDRGRAGHDRDFFDRAGDEVASWFGDEEAERRREMDHRRERNRGRYEAYERGDDHRGRGPRNYKRSDERLLEDVCEHLTRDRGVDASDIEVTAKGGEVTLDGKVNTRWEKRRAEDCVHDISGISHVQNNLRIRQTEMRAGREESSENITAKSGQ